MTRPRSAKAALKAAEDYLEYVKHERIATLQADIQALSAGLAEREEARAELAEAERAAMPPMWPLLRREWQKSGHTSHSMATPGGAEEPPCS